MSYFLTDLKVEHFEEVNSKGKTVRKVRLLEDLVYYSVELHRFVTVPAGFVSDGASVPRALWFCFHPYGKYLKAAIVHDFFCVHKTIDSRTAAKVFKEAMEVCGVVQWKRRSMYRAVRLFGPRFKAKV